jgi:hypothetical protein
MQGSVGETARAVVRSFSPSMAAGKKGKIGLYGDTTRSEISLPYENKRRMKSALQP